ncbi:hypothetical protein RF55_8792 [Lasius niger]|uniref:Uncharacterized protein n=1 Tax=Lasius niger TaxID=67767 RepID=A0A0J7KM38_LASNI|nr:hypothetical protein RF55_8792 [Lasius niger]
MCTSLSEKDCGSKMTTSSLQPVECTMSKMNEWQRKIQQHRVLNSIADLFAVDAVQHYQATTPRDMNCAKMVLNGKYTCCK